MEAATVRGGEVAGMLGAVKSFEAGEHIFLLTDLKAAIEGSHQCGKAGRQNGKGKKKGLETISRRYRNQSAVVSLKWVKSHIGVEGNEKAIGCLHSLFLFFFFFVIIIRIQHRAI